MLVTAVPATPPSPTPSSTPLPSSTPAPSPTPQQYIVQAGDTLLDIALRYGITLDDLRAANAGTDLSLLQIGQTLNLPAAPLPAEVALQSPSADMAAPSLALAAEVPECYATRAGGVLCLGRVINDTALPAEGVTLDVRLVQGDGGLAAQEAAALEQMTLPPTSFAPYRAQFDVSWALYRSMGLQPRATVTRAEAALNYEARFAVPALRDVQTQTEPGRFIVTALLVNEEAGSIDGVRAVVTVLDAAGRVIGYRVVTFAGRTFVPGETAPLRVEVIPAAPLAIVDYHIHVEARRM